MNKPPRPPQPPGEAPDTPQAVQKDGPRGGKPRLVRVPMTEGLQSPPVLDADATLPPTPLPVPAAPPQTAAQATDQAPADKAARRAANKANNRANTKTNKKAQSAPNLFAPEKKANAVKGNAKGNANANRKRKGGQSNKKPKAKRPVTTVVEVAPVATPARLRRRHWGLILSFCLLVLAPLGLSAAYLWMRAVDQYASTVGFTVRQEQGAGSTDLLTGFAAQLGGGSGSSDTDILFEFIQSQSLVAQIDAKFDLRRLYSVPYQTDPVFALRPGASLEDLLDYWQRIVRISYDENAQLIELRVLAFEAQLAQDIGRDILARSQALINDLNAQSRTDTLRYAEGDLEAAQERLKAARAELIRFRTRTQLVDPETDLQGRLGVVNTLQGQLAEALIEADLLAQSTNQNDPRVVQARRRIEVIRDRIADERANVARGDETDVNGGADYPTLLAEYEALVADREFAEQSYLAALAALDAAKADAARQSRYVATYVAPTYPETAEFPQRWTLFGLVSLFLLLSWFILSLIYYSIRDSK